MMRKTVRTVVVWGAIFASLLLTSQAFSQETLTVRVGMQAVGTFSWVVHAMEYFGIDDELGLNIEGITYATKQATEIALRAGEVDVTVDDFVGVVLMRGRDIPVRAIYPYGKAVGGVVVPVDSDVQMLEDLQGKTIAAASLDDKSLLILRALTSTQYGFDPQVDGETIAAGPWLMAGLMDNGEIDVAIPYWHYVARMTGTGRFRDVMMVTDMLDQLGLSSDLPILVVVGHEATDPEVLTTFIKALQMTTAAMVADSDDGIWASILENELYTLPDPSVFPEVRARWEAGLPEVWNQELIDGLVDLVEGLVEVAGAEVVGIERIDPEAFTTAYLP